MKHIGILNLIEHLEETVEGFKNVLEQEGLDATYIYFNAHGREDKLADYGRRLLKKNLDIIFACSTPSAMALRDVMDKKCLPVVYAPVFNPSIAALVDSSDRILKYFTGVSGMVAPELKIEMMQKIFKHLKKITLFFDPLDENSTFELEKLTEEIVKKQLQYETCPLPNGKIQPQILSTTDNPVLLTFSLKIEEHLQEWINRAIELAIPVVASSKRGAVFGCLAGLYADHYQLGKMAAQKAMLILKGIAPADIQISYAEDCKVVCNYMTATGIDFDFPYDLSSMSDIC